MRKIRFFLLLFAAAAFSLMTPSCESDDAVAPTPGPEQGGETPDPDPDPDPDPEPEPDPDPKPDPDPEPEPEPDPDPKPNPEPEPEPEPDVMLKLRFDLSAEIAPTKQLPVRYEFSEQTSAIALIRSNATEEVIYLPLTMKRAADGRATVEGVDVPLHELKAEAGQNWQMRLLMGGKWDAASKRITFAPQMMLEPTNRLEKLTLDQPYVSSWTQLQTDEKGQFVVAENGNTPVDMKVMPCGSLFVHHIKSCDAPAIVGLNSLNMDLGAVYFTGYYDLSDAAMLKGMKDNEDFGWGYTDKQTSLAVNFAEPVEIEVGDNLDGYDYIYVWGIPTQKDAQISVTASGFVMNADKQEFKNVTIFNGAMLLNEYQEIGSSLKVKAPAPKEGPIELSTVDGKTSIVADGQDKIEFVIMQDGKDVTDKCTIHKKHDIFDDAISGHVFTSKRSGSFEFYATKGDKKSNSIFVSVTSADEYDENGNLINGLLFCDGVSMSSGWTDVNKNWNGDGLLCWAATASNMLQWWMTDLQKKGYTIPDSVPFGQGNTYSLKIFDVFQACWVDYMHSTDNGIRWFLEGGGMKWASNYCTPDRKGYVEDGGYFVKADVLPADEERKWFNSEYVVSYGAYSSWMTTNGVHNDSETIKKKFTAMVVRLLKEGISALSVDSHETTLWGCELKNGLVVKVFIANSDDNQTKLVPYEVYESGGDMHLKGYPGKTQLPTQIIRLTGLKAYSK